MSYVCLLAADHPLPLYDPGLRRITTSRVDGTDFTFDLPGFSVQPHQYYRDAVEALGLTLKPWQYELDLQPTQEEATLLRTYLAQYCASGETVELWNIWVGDDREAHIPRYQGRLSDLSQDTLEQLCCPPLQNDCPGQCCLTVMI